MKKSNYKFIGRQRLYFALLSFSLLTGISFLINSKTQAEAESNSLPTAYHNNSLKSFKPQGVTSPTVNVGERASVWLKLEPGKSLDTTFHGSNSAISALQGNLAEPTSQVSADINADGYADLISGFRNAAGGGLIALHRASKEAFEPQNEKVLADLKRGIFPAAFEKDALVMNVPTAPDFIVSGKFSLDSAVDVVFASRGGRSIYLMTSDGNGGFNAPQEIAVGGEITALTSGNINYRGGYAGIVAAVSGDDSSNLLIFDGGTELDKTAPRIIPIAGKVGSLILASTNGANPSMELFGLSDGGIFTIANIGKSKSRINRIELPFRTIDFAVGEFIRDREGKPEIAVLSDSGAVSYLTNGTLDTRPWTTAEVVAQWKQNGGRGRGSLTNKTATKVISNDWSVAETHQPGVYALNETSPHLLQKARITGNETDDLLLLNPQNNQVEILFKEPNRDKNRTAFTGETKSQNVNFAQTPATVLPMRLNVMGQQGFVYFSKGSLEPISVMAAPNALFTVTKTADTNDGACNADCSVREAVRAANAAAGADMISIPSGTFQLTIAGANENASATGDLDVTQALTITGNGSANTIIQAGTTTANGIDKVLSFNPSFTLAFASSISGVTVRFGRNPGTFTGDGFGGGFDWEGSGTGTMTVSGCVVTDNRTTDGDGGGIAATNSSAGNGTFTAMNTTVANNMPARAGAVSPFGGGIFAGTATPFLLTNVIINNNNVNGSAGQGQGGGIYAFNPSGGTRSFLTGSTVTNNSAPNDGGGIATFQPIDINPTAIISNNSSGRSGGGIFVNHANATTNISKVTMVGNSATTSGGAVYLGTSTVANVLNMSFSRIVGNTSGSFNGLLTTGGTANVTNNWWGCNTGPSAAPCDTAGAAGGVVNFTPWLRYTHTASPSSIVVGQSTTLTASFLTNSAGTAIAASNLDVLIGVTATFNNAVRGTISGSPTTIQASGTATATFTGTSVGAGSANAAVDNGTATASITIAQAATTTAVTSNANPSVVGQTVTLTATVSVTAPGSGTPTGTIQFKDGAATIAGCSAVALSGGTAQCMTGALSVGSHSITAVYSGDTNFTGSTSPALTQTVNKANTTTTITADTPDPSVIGQNYAVTASVSVTSPGAGTPTGTITVSDGTNNCTITLPATSCNLPSTSPGAKTLTATYNGDSNFSASPASAGVAHTVNKADTTTTITNDTPDPSVVGQPYAVTASVAVNAPGAGTPTGTITVSDGSQTCTITLPATSCNLTSTTAGAKTLTATYNGNANFNASPASAGVAHTVNPAATTTTINSNTPNPSMQNTPVTVTYSVAVNSPGAGTPTGTVTVSDGVNSCMASVAAGSCMITLTTSGTRTLTATYSNDANFNASTSSGVSQTVLAPTAASVEVSGRVMTNSGRGISSARVTITDQLGNSRSATTSAFGYFRFIDVQAGEICIISVVSKRYQFAPQVLNITEDLTDLTFVALQ